MTYLFTHDDLDGVGSAVVAYLAYPGSLTVKYCSYKTINSEITALLDSLQSPASILIADINVDEETANRLDCSGCDVRLFDHHPSGIMRPWMTISTSSEECGSTLLAKALLPEAESCVLEFIDTVCKFDTWRFEKNTGAFPERLNALHDMLGHRGFVEMVLQSLSGRERFTIPHYFELAIAHSFDERKRYFEAKEKAMVTTTLAGYKTGVVFAEHDISLMAEYVFQKHPRLDIVAVSYMPAGVSLRTRRDDINLTEICRQRGGGGHQKASAFYLSGKAAEHAVEQILRQEA